MRKALLIVLLLTSFASFSEDESCLKRIIPAVTRNYFNYTDSSFTIGQVHILQHIYYDFDHTGLRKESMPHLDSAVSFLCGHPELFVEISNHTDSRGSDTYNTALSQHRSRSIVKYLLVNGVPEHQVVAKGYGENCPINDCSRDVDCPDSSLGDCPCHQKNRRTELKIIGFIETNEDGKSTRSSINDFAPIGAKWHYALLDAYANKTTWALIESIKDTQILGKSCRKIEESYDTRGLANTYYFYEDSGKVYTLKQDSLRWCLLYNFNVNAGDSFELPCYLNTITGNPLMAYVDTVFQIMINGQSRKVQYITCEDKWQIWFNGYVVEGIGNENNLFPTYHQFGPFWVEPLRCYEDSILGLYKNQFFKLNAPYSDNCEAIFLSTPEQDKQDVKISIHPNPFTIYTTISIDESLFIQHHEIDLILYDVLGKVVKVITMESNRSFHLDRGDLFNGIYFYQLAGDGKVLDSGKIVIQ